MGQGMQWGRPVALTLALLGCAPGNVADPAAEASAVGPSRPVTADSDPAPESAPAQVAMADSDPDPEPEPAAPEIADSRIQTGFFVDPGAQAGLVAFVAALPQAGSLWVGKLEGNGGRDVLIFIPPGADDAKPFELVFHFHGTYSEHVEQQREGLKKNQWVGWERLGQTLAAVTELQQTRAHNVALIYPFSAGKRLEPGHRGWSNVAYDRMWMDPVAPPDFRDDFAKLYDESVAILQAELGLHPSKIPDAVIAEGHSAGGVALLNIARNGSAHVREYIFLDASFQSWADGCYTAVKDSGAAAKLTLVVTDKGIADPFTGRDPWCVDMKADAALWTGKKSWCVSRANEEVPGSDWTCEQLELRAQEWRDDYQAWCVAYEDGMRSLAGVTLIPTKVYHKDQPRHFAGGLELPDDRLR
jgi:pimeloyl-ACP methyl ester carboxylesterase